MTQVCHFLDRLAQQVQLLQSPDRQVRLAQQAQLVLAVGQLVQLVQQE